MTLRQQLRQLRGRLGQTDDAGDRWVVVDIESSGLDTERDRLIAVAAVAVHWMPARDRAPRIAMGDSFEAVLRQTDPSINRQNILLHGIGVGEQREGLAPQAALAAFEAWTAGAPLLAFHAPFDQRMLARASRAHLGRVPENEWLDLAPLAGVLLPDVPARSLDQWLRHFELHCLDRHRAAADALATAELFIRLYPLLRAQTGARPAIRTLQRLAAQRRWLAPHQP